MSSDVFFVIIEYDHLSSILAFLELAFFFNLSYYCRDLYFDLLNFLDKAESETSVTLLAEQSSKYSLY